MTCVPHNTSSRGRCYLIHEQVELLSGSVTCLVLWFKLNAFTITHICFFGIKSLLFKKKSLWVLHSELERMLYMPKIKEKPLGIFQIPSAVSSLPFCSVQEMWYTMNENCVSGAHLEGVCTKQANCQHGLCTTCKLTGPGCVWQLNVHDWLVRHQNILPARSEFLDLPSIISLFFVLVSFFCLLPWYIFHFLATDELYHTYFKETLITPV